MPPIRDIALDIDEIKSVASPALPPIGPDTDPAVIVATHRELVAAECPAVRAAWRRFRCVPTDAQLADCLSHALDLHPWCVARALGELGLAAPPVPVASHAEKRAVGADRHDKVFEFLSRVGKYVTVAEMVSGTGLTPYQVRQCLDWVPSPFKRVVIRAPTRIGFKRVFAYQILGFSMTTKRLSVAGST